MDLSKATSFNNQVASATNLAVNLKGIRVAHGYGSRAVEILKGIDLQVPEGRIYGLLGPSGCGKTTLLRTIVGRLQPNAGLVNVYGKIPGDPSGCIPGSGVGYMPQELTLFPEFTIAETLRFFGRLARMMPDLVEERIIFLCQFLDLPDKNRLVRNLSGGQQRRVSLAAALIHRPPLLILDEPTVGVDPLLRHSIWRYLVTLTMEDGLTIIVTTHYIEEARQADIVGLMRKGRMLAQDEPEALLKNYDKDTLESVFLALCMADNDANNGSDLSISSTLFPGNNSDTNLATLEARYRTFGDSTFDLHKKPDVVGFRKELPQVHRFSDSGIRIKTLIRKNFTRLLRNLPILLFNFFVPSIQVILFCISIGNDPFDLPVVIVNHDPNALSRSFLEHINNRTVIQHYVQNATVANEYFESGRTWGLVEIGENFTEALQMRFLMGLNVDQETINQSIVNVKLDMTNKQISLTLQKTLFEAFNSFCMSMLKRMHKDPSTGLSPLVFTEAAYKTSQITFMEFMAPGIILSITYIVAIGLTSLSVIVERKEGTMERTFVQGVRPWEVIIGHLISQFLVMVGQAAMLLFFSLYAFKIPVYGSLWLIFVLTVLQGLCGMTFGLLISSICSDEITSVMLSLAAFYPNILLSGVLWPIQSMPHILRFFAYGLPQTMAIESMRCIMYRAWNFAHDEVSIGFVTSIAWALFFLLCATLSFKTRK